MSVANWTVNDTPISDAAMLTAEAVVTWVNQNPDTFSWRCDTDDFTVDHSFAYGMTVTLKRNGVVWFRGVIREVPRQAGGGEEGVRFVARGAWDVLERKAYLQNFKAPADPSDPDSELIEVKRGRVVLGQGDDGLKVNLSTFVSQVITYAGLTPSVYLGSITVPFDEVTDYSCADVISRLLQWVPDAVVWFDYSTTPATCHVQTRPNLESVTVAIDSGLVTSFSINPRYDLISNRVALFYIATNRDNDASWEVTTPDVYPPDTTGEEDGALVRTIRLAGSVATSSYLTQKTKSRFITEGLVFAGTVKEGEESFSNIASFWKRRVAWLAKAGVVIKGFRKGTRTNDADEDFNTECERELYEGAITDWMQTDFAIVGEPQKFTVEVAVDVPVKTGVVERQFHALTARLLAGNVQSRTYSLLESGSYTAPEAVPVGLAQTLHDIVSTLQWDVVIEFTEESCTARPGVGHVYNFTGGRAEWQSANALVQSRSCSLGTGVTTITAGPPRQVGVDTLVGIFQNNRSRQPVTSNYVRATGKTGGGRGMAQGLGVLMPINESSSNPLPPSSFTAEVTAAGLIPTVTELNTAIIGVYLSVELAPKSGDQVQITKGGRVILCYQIALNGSAPGGGTIYNFSFTIGTVIYYARGWQVGLY